ncbi:UDP-2,3-diacylglucosamine diphosphatase [candidate division KSB1 bacterium]|nr:UDP-2,3-diacylglucosamine diphosphatase [candidate division KSB1 bacterium]
MVKYYFISDIHIGAGTEAEEEKKFFRLKSFFNYIKKPGNELFIVGDLFDYWFEYNHVVPNKFYGVFFEISKLIESGVSVNFLRGNHDCWLKDFLSDQVNINVLPDIYTTQIDNKKIFIFHGDGILKNDKGYRLLKKIIRHPLSIFLFRCLHPDIGIPLTKQMSQTSKHYTSTKVYSHKDEYIDYAKNKFNDRYDYVILGHSHEAIIEEIEGKVLISLGDWIKHFSYGLISNGTASLNFWNS